MNAGGLVERLLVQRNTAPANTHGALTPAVWTTLDTMPAELLQVSGAEALEGSQVGARFRYRFRIRARGDLRPSMRILWRPVWPSSSERQVLEIDAILTDPADRGYLLLDCGRHETGGTA